MNALARLAKSLTGPLATLRWRSPAGPKASVDTGPTVPGAVLHAVVAALAVGAFLIAAASDVATGLLVTVCVIITVVAAVSLRRPGYGPLLVSFIPTTAVLVAVAPVGYSWRVPLLMIAFHALVRLSSFTTQVSASTRVELAVLRSGWRRFAVINLIGQSAALFAGALTLLSESAGAPAPGMTWLAVAGALLLVALAVALRSGARAWPWREPPLPR